MNFEYIIGGDGGGTGGRGGRDTTTFRNIFSNKK